MQSAQPAPPPQLVQPPQSPQPQGVREAGSAEPWAALLDAGLKLVETLAITQRGNGGAPANPQWIETDARTGKTYLKLPVPEPATVHQAPTARRPAHADARCALVV